MGSWGSESGVGLLDTFICLGNRDTNMITPFIYYLLVRVSGTKEATEGPSEDSMERSQGTDQKSTVKKMRINGSEKWNSERARSH